MPWWEMINDNGGRQRLNSFVGVELSRVEGRVIPSDQIGGADERGLPPRHICRLPSSSPLEATPDELYLHGCTNKLLPKTLSFSALWRQPCACPTIVIFHLPLVGKRPKKTIVTIVSVTSATPDGFHFSGNHHGNTVMVIGIAAAVRLRPIVSGDCPMHLL
ncbi:MAG: hypothetical protein FRX48_05968 [Lasallia pustulata]|uniref:Uncharacterized protein n=1 Tax=Lasallia pustulata TaxID=136370 RepID=A0A5M8PNQ0_9LECA|nr:MAG: hypothetical protein FRX48_05968 [Lasallia pustulata]